MLNKSQQIYLVGIKGVGMTALAQILQNRGKKISGSDTTEKFFTDQVLRKLKIPYKEGFKASNLRKSLDLIIYSTAFNPKTHPELIAAKQKKISMMSYPQVLSHLFNGELGIAISGTHGKTTTSALTAVTMKNLGLNPTAVVGSRVADWQTNAMAGKGPFFVIEADEHQNKLKNYRPWSMIITNIDYDHPDFYRNPENYFQAFKTWVGRWQKAKNPLPKIGIFNGDDPKSKRLIKELKLKSTPDAVVLTFGKGKENNIRLSKKSIFEISIPGLNKTQITVKSSLIGEHNQFNLAAALAFLIGLNIVANKISQTGDFELAPIPLGKIARSFASFSGTERRMQLIGSRGKVRVYDDYAHHPSEIRSALKTFKESFPQSDLWVIFQPHTFTRTRAFLKEFAKSLGKADFIGLLPIYGSAREKKATITSEAIAKFFRPDKCVYFPSHKDCLDFLNNYRFGKSTLLVTMGAGDGWQVGRKYLKIK